MSIFKKTNAPYLVSGALAIGTLLASGIFAVAPYVAFLAPVAALSLGLPFIVGGAIFSVAVIALSAVVINKNNTISEKEAQIEAKGKEIAKKDDEISSLEKLLDEEKDKVEAQQQKNSKLKTQLAEKDEKIEKDALKVAIADGAVWSVKEAANGTWYIGKYIYNHSPSKETLGSVVGNVKNACGTYVSSAGNHLQGAYSASIEFGKERLSSSLQSAKDIQRASQEAFVTVKEACSSGRLLGIFKRDLTDAYNACGTYVSSTWRYVGEKISTLKNNLKEQPKRHVEDRFKPNMQELTRFDYEDQDVFYDAESGDEEDQDIFYDAESGDEKDTKVSSLKEQLDEKGETNVYNNALDANLLHTQHKNTLTNTPQEEVEISKVEQKKAQKPEEQADRKLKDNSVNNQEQGSKNKRSGAARKKGKRTQVQPRLHAVETSNRSSCLSPNQECP